MFGLPAASLAMYQRARPENRKAIGGVMLSTALTAFLTGITEPIEFAFMFLAPALYAIHAVLTGVSLALLDVLGVRHGFSFSAGAIDFALNYGLSTKGWLILPVGLAYAAVYYVLFSFVIERFNLATPGREAPTAALPAAPTGAPTEDLGLAAQLLRALGGHRNIREIDACITRLRLVMVNRDLVKDAELKALGAKGVVRPGTDSLQVILGPMAESIANEMRQIEDVAAPSGAGASAKPPRADQEGRAQQWMAALGGRGNIKAVEGFESGRVRVELADEGKLDEAKLLAAQVQAVMRLPNNVVHLIVGADATQAAAALQQQLDA
jgi:PTS system N-acetylglucosamine-specific IIC component